jgi:SNF2 family DNA or RNA helicase
MSKASKHALKPLWDEFEYKPHQVVGVEWMIERDDDGGGIVADEMGLGKTIQLLALLKNSNTSHTLLIAPLAVLEQWKSTAERSSIRVYLLNNKEWVLKTAMFSNRTSIYICSYETAQRNLRLINAMEFDRLICDEAHRLSNPKTIAFQMIDTINVPKRWFLTATPIVNSIRDIKSLFKLLRIEDENNIYENIPTYVLARSMSDLENAPLVPITHTHNLDFITEEEAEFYRGIQDKIVNQLKYGELNGLDKLALLLRLRQLSINPNVYVEMKRKKKVYLKPFQFVSTKFQQISYLLNSESHETHKWIIFCHFHEEMIMLKEFLNTLEFIRHIGIYSGKLNIDERSSLLNELKEEFNDERMCDVLIIQLQSGGVGLNLQEFDRIIFTSPWWTQSMMNQAVGRAVRIGQTKQVVVHHLHLNEEKTLNIDRLMNEKAKTKGLLNEQILNMANRNVGT